MNEDRLERLAVLLEKDAANPKGVQFDLRTWAKLADALDHECFIGGKLPTLDCGTKACAFGLAAISGVFKDDGLGYKIHDKGVLCPTFGNETDYNAAQKFFDISFRQAVRLFDPLEYEVTVGADAELCVVKRIRNLIADPTRYDY